MGKKSVTAADLQRIVEQLRADRRAHLDAVEEIEGTLREFGIDPDSGGRRRGRKPGRPKGSKTKRRKRGTFSVTAETFIMDMVKGKPLPTAEVNKRWTAAGRGGSANNTLTKLVKERKLKKQKIKGARGSKYGLA